jgi:Xaa-Pro dipeptidase
VGFTNLGYKLKAGDIVFVDPAGEWRHYWSDTGRTAVVGEPNQKLERLYAGLRTCHETVARELAPGASFGSLSAIARKVVDPDVRRGFMVLFHSMGLEQYDHPRTSTEFGGGGLTLETDMVVNFETLYFELGWGVLQLEDTYLITTGGAEKIGTLPRDLVVV